MHCGFYEELDALKKESEFVDAFNFLENIYCEFSSDLCSCQFGNSDIAVMDEMLKKLKQEDT